jgi:hypothetical protein
MWEHSNCRECEENPERNGCCAAFNKEHREYEMRRRDRTAMKEWIDRSFTGRANELMHELDELERQFPPGSHKYGPPTVRVRFLRLHFLMARETALPHEKIRRRWGQVEVSSDETSLNWEFLAEYRLRVLKARAPYVDKLIAACKEVGFAPDDPYLADLLKQRRELRRELRKQVLKTPAKAMAARA